MKSDKTDYSLLFHTAADIPPPLAFRALIRIRKEGDYTHVAFSREFTGREEIPVQEIEAEGFSQDDDFSWDGILPGFWMDEAMKLAEETEWKEASETQVLLSASENGEWISPSRETGWILFCEELIQASLEEGGRELPMEMAFGELLKNNFYEQLSLEWRFAQREIYAQSKDGNRQVFSGRDWDEGAAQLKIWMEEEAGKNDLYQPPRSKGNYWLINDELWLPARSRISGRVWEWALQHTRS